MLIFHAHLLDSPHHFHSIIHFRHHPESFTLLSYELWIKGMGEPSTWSALRVLCVAEKGECRKEAMY
jgi:hypothetical protein